MSTYDPHAPATKDDVRLLSARVDELERLVRELSRGVDLATEVALDARNDWPGLP